MFNSYFNKTFLIGLLLLSTVIVSATIIYMLFIDNNGNMKAVNIEVYNDPELINKVTDIEWGIFEPGQSKSIPVWIKNTGNSDVHIYLYTQLWVPDEVEDYITVSWGYSGEILKPNDVIQVILTVTVSKDISNIQTFSFQIIIQSEG